QSAGETGARLNDSIDGTGSDVDPGKRPSHHSQNFAYEPILLMTQNEFVTGENRVRVSCRLDNPQAQVQLARAQSQDGVIQLPRHLQRPPICTSSHDSFQAIFASGFWSAHRHRCRASLTVVLYVHVLVM